MKVDIVQLLQIESIRKAEKISVELTSTKLRWHSFICYMDGRGVDVAETIVIWCRIGRKR